MGVAGNGDQAEQRKRDGGGGNNDMKGPELEITNRTSKEAEMS